MHFLPTHSIKGKYVRLGMSRLGEPVVVSENANFESRVINMPERNFEGQMLGYGDIKGNQVKSSDSSLTKKVDGVHMI